MCGIVGFTGRREAAPVILDGLTRLEYRGYDSAGIAIDTGEGIRVRKAVGRLDNLVRLTDGGRKLLGLSGIGHTRWATHGAVTEANAHPQTNADGTIAVVHNGIIENYAELKSELRAEGVTFVSDTDTEVVALLLDRYYEGNPVSAISLVMKRIEGSYALGIIFADHLGEVYAARKDSPLIVGVGRDGSGMFIASDVPAISIYIEAAYYPDQLQIVKLTADDASFYSIDEEPLTLTSSPIEDDTDAADKCGYSHYMLREIYEQPSVVERLVQSRLAGGTVQLPELDSIGIDIAEISRIRVIACGSAYHVAVAAKYVIEGIAGVPVETEPASEFRYRDLLLDPTQLVIIISQSGETADALAALRIAHKHGCRVLGIVNVTASSIAREADAVIYTEAGPEIAVATTKAYSAQLIVVYLLAMRLAGARGKTDIGTNLTDSVSQTITEKSLKLTDRVSQLLDLPGIIRTVLDTTADKIQSLAARYLSARDIYFIGRGLDYATALEGALKLKEISYIHADAYAAGELKHGPIALMETDTLVIALATQPDLYAKTAANMQEVRTRGAKVLAITTDTAGTVAGAADYVIVLPEVNAYFTDSIATIPLQLFAYYVAVGKGCDVDKPRNLAKSVTVE